MNFDKIETRIDAIPLDENPEIQKYLNTVGEDGWWLAHIERIMNQCYVVILQRVKK